MTIYLRSSPTIKPPLWTCSPYVVAYNCARMGLPVPDAAYVWGGGDQWPNLIGNQYDGSIDGATWETGKLKFDGTNDKVNVGRIVLSTAITLVAWIKPTATTNQQNSTVISKEYGPGDPWVSYMIKIAADDVDLSPSFSVDVGGLRTANATENLDANKEYCLIGTWKTGDYVRFYINGKQDGISANIHSGSIRYNAFDTYIGYTEIDNVYYKGYVDSATIFPVALNSNQVQTFYNNRYGMVEPIRSPAIWSTPAVGVAPTGAFYGPLYGPLGGSI